MDHTAAFEANRTLWNAMTEAHIGSRFYDVEGFIKDGNSLSDLEKALLGDVRGKKILHLQCHFGQDTLSMARMGGHVTGLDMSDTAISKAQELADRCGLHADWVRANVLDHQPQLDGLFDIVFTSYGTIGWLPELGAWAANIRRYLKPGGRFIFVEFHPVLWMFDNEFKEVQWSYFNRQPIVEVQKGTYAEPGAPIELPSHGWNHSLGDVLSALLTQDLRIEHFSELDGSHHDCFPDLVRGTDGLYRFKDREGLLPMVYALKAARS